jgi:hypothetical protein
MTRVICDRCGSDVEPAGAALTLEVGWFRHDGMAIDLCRRCSESLAAWILKYSKPVEQSPPEIQPKKSGVRDY